MGRNEALNALSKPIGCFFMGMGTFLLFIKIIRDYIPVLKPYSFELFLISPIFLILGLRLICRKVKFKFLRISSGLLFGMAMIYFILLSFSWYSIHIM